MKKSTIIIVVAIVITLATVTGIVFASQQRKEKVEPWYFTIEYIDSEGMFHQNRIMAESVFGQNLQLKCKKNTGVSLRLGMYEEYKLTDINALTVERTSYSRGNVVCVDHQTHMGSTSLEGIAGPDRTILFTLNVGTEEAPRWVSFQIETICDVFD